MKRAKVGIPQHLTLPRKSGLGLPVLPGPTLVVLLAILCCFGCGTVTPSEGDQSGPEAAAKDVPRGLRVKKAGLLPGYVLFAPLLSDVTYLVDEDGKVVHTWKSDLSPSGSVYFLENGNLLRASRLPELKTFSGGGQGGRIEEFTWDGELVWEFDYSTEDYLLHHDIELMPNGNILAIAWERKTPEEARKAGRRIDLIPEQGLWPDKVVEIQPTRPSGGRIVWEWHAWDHLVQDYDKDADNYGDPAKQPFRININGDGKAPEVDPEELERLKALGYVPDDADADDISSDLFHTNAVDYNAELDQIALSTPHFNEIWIIDHATSSAEAAGSSGGRRGRGGDLLYRWGNPAVYHRGSEQDQQLFGQHDVRWIPEGLPGAGHLMVFNNGLKGPEGDYSAIFELQAPLTEEGLYTIADSQPFGPSGPSWTYTAPDKVSFSSGFISGAERLSNGNTMICSGADGRLLEVTPEGEIVWEYWSLFSGNVKTADGSLPQPVGRATYAIFRASKIPADHPGLQGRNLAPLDPQPEPVKGPEVTEEQDQ